LRTHPPPTPTHLTQKQMNHFKLKIKKAELVPDKYGQHLKITMIGVYTPEGKWIKWAKINEHLLKTLTENENTIITTSL